MPTPKLDPKKLNEVLSRYTILADLGYSIREAAIELNVPRTTLSDYIQRGRDLASAGRAIESEIDIPNPPDASEPIEDLVHRKKAAFDRNTASDTFHHLIPLGIKLPGPVAICAVGDPHVDDDRCDIAALERDMRIIGRTEGMYALHVGDLTNNWVGRLGRLYAHQATKAGDAIRLVEWMFGLAKPLAVVGGNHDLWNEGMSWLNFAVKQAGTKILQEHGVRLELNFPKGQSVRIHTRHDFPGNSQFNPLHGLRKEHLFGLRDHVNIAGHRHIDSAAVIPSPDGYMHWMLRVSGYKGHDDFAKSLNLQKMKMAPTCALIIDPTTRHPAELVKPFWDLEEAADFLAFKRGRA